MRLRKRIQRSQCYGGSSFGSFNETAEAASVVSMRQWNPLKSFNNIIFPQKGSYQHKTMSKIVWIPRSQWDHRSRFSGFNETTRSGLRGLNETAESDSAVSMRPQEADSEVSMRPRKQIQQFQWDHRKRTQRSQWDRGSLYKNYYWLLTMYVNFIFTFFDVYGVILKLIDQTVWYLVKNDNFIHWVRGNSFLNQKGKIQTDIGLKQNHQNETICFAFCFRFEFIEPLFLDKIPSKFVGEQKITFCNFPNFFDNLHMSHLLSPTVM
jgi:hypothetical protein